jgi:hypothetical protein
MAIGYGVACPKPPTRKTLKGRKDRAEAKQKHLVRMLCVARDGDCRFGRPSQGGDFKEGSALVPFNYQDCRGESEWAHMHSRRRSQTRGQAPEVRHDTSHSLMLCTKHHQDYDAHKLRITSLTRKGADGPLKFRRAQ